VETVGLKESTGLKIWKKYKLKKMLLSGSGALALRWRFLSPGLYVFNYHRIGDSSATVFDPNVFSCDEEHFDAQLETIAARFRVINSSELLELIEGGAGITEPLAMISFDDGYEDNYSKAFPLLAARNLPAIFFLPTNFIGTANIPWWDAVAWLVRNTDENILQLRGLGEPITVETVDIARSIRQVLRWFKGRPNTSSIEKLEELAVACNCELEADAASALFMTWDQAREMLNAGMDIGSHTLSHQILSDLNLDEQREELSRSKSILETEIGSEVSVLAYPAGGLDSYTRETARLARGCGYRAAFNFTKGGGYNPDPKANPFDLARIPVENQATPTDIKMSALAVPKID
jgi:peptidoglycan/xylan/chitin deacetylase (PgdA/CDA1 family)